MARVWAPYKYAPLPSLLHPVLLTIHSALDTHFWEHIYSVRFLPPPFGDVVIPHPSCKAMASPTLLLYVYEVLNCINIKLNNQS